MEQLAPIGVDIPTDARHSQIHTFQKRSVVFCRPPQNNPNPFFPFPLTKAKIGTNLPALLIAARAVQGL